ncbi:hypothetical protein A2970_02540 [Candidatus Roizmanbacteria bacterium RIFCSPLOWO2_01_FULL_44_13]|uniref:Uncharacterized protein n=1 Tax=Candidatus Roizmanbacteria bacterium RIFCSPLOWO2_01_FULL_44_13 TaxID=1802069 RepID=A0A1F7JCT5_9BACT|nr:MAG: hypothetical protein A2970_02540 [Candidatus Roizmanbacteria bacterium RIFCSPLOWO2_01_FULL_44_13]
MDAPQFLLIVAITVTTILVVVTGLQLIFVLRELRSAIKKNGHLLVNLEKKEIKEEKTKEKKYQKKLSTLHSILGKIKLLVPSHSNKGKRFFIKDN